MEFLAKIDNLRPMLEWIRKQLKDMKFDAKTLNKMEVGCEEALVNIMEHVYKDGNGKIEIEVKPFPRSHVEIVIADYGPAANPLSGKKPLDPSVPIEEREIGGVGIHLIQKIMDKVSYRRHGDKNVLVLVKKAKAFF